MFQTDPNLTQPDGAVNNKIYAWIRICPLDWFIPNVIFTQIWLKVLMSKGWSPFDWLPYWFCRTCLVRCTVFVVQLLCFELWIAYNTLPLGSLPADSFLLHDVFLVACHFLSRSDWETIRIRTLTVLIYTKKKI